MFSTDSDGSASARGFSTMVVGMAGAIITVAALPFSSVRLSSGRMLLALSLLAMHLTACGVYFYYVQHNPADTTVYYFDKYHLNDNSFAFGTVFVTKLTQVLRKTFDGSYLECFILFQSVGFWGVMLLMRSFQEIHLKLGVPETSLPSYLMFLPSIHFWTSAIGKDAPLFFAVSICVWSALQWRNRLVPFALGLVVMILFRAHIALIAVMALAAAAVLHPGISFGRKIALLGVTMVGGLILAGTVESTIHVNVTDASSVATFLQDRNDIAAKVGGGTSIGDAPLYIRFLSLLFRPFFYDATNVPGYVASVENLGSVMLFAYFLKSWRSALFLARRVFFVEFCMVFAVILIVLLTLINYNIGLALRERVMIFPPLLCTFVALWALPRNRNAVTARFSPTPFVPQLSPNRPISGSLR